MAEWPTAPDSRQKTSLTMECSGLRMEACAQIPLLTKWLFFHLGKSTDKQAFTLFHEKESFEMPLVICVQSNIPMGLRKLTTLAESTSYW